MSSLLPHHFINDSIGDAVNETAALPSSRGFSPASIGDNPIRNVTTPLGLGNRNLASRETPRNLASRETPRETTPRRVMRSTPNRLEQLEPHESPMKLPTEAAKSRRAGKSTSSRSTMPAKKLSEIQGHSRRRSTMDRIFDEHGTFHRKESVTSSASTGVSTPPSNEPQSNKETPRSSTKSRVSEQHSERRSSKETPRAATKSSYATDLPQRKPSKEARRASMPASSHHEHKETVPPASKTLPLPTKDARSGSKGSAPEQPTRRSSSKGTVAKDDVLGLHKFFGVGAEESEEEEPEEEAEEEPERPIMLYRPKEVEQITVRAEDFFKYKDDVKTLRKCAVDASEEQDAADTNEATKIDRSARRPHRRATIGGHPGSSESVPFDSQKPGAKGLSRARSMSKVMTALAPGATSHTPRASTKTRPDQQLRSTVEAFREEDVEDLPVKAHSETVARSPSKRWQQAAKDAVAARV